MSFPVKILLLFLTLLPLANIAQADQLDIKGIRLGMTQIDVKALQPEIFCGAYSTAGSDTACHFKGLLTYAGARAELFVLLKEEKVITAWVTVNSDDFENVVSALKEKFGKPSSTSVEKVQNLSGAKFDNPSLHWVKDGKILSATKFSGKVTESKISLSEFNILDSLNKYKENIKKKAQDL